MIIYTVTNKCYYGDGGYPGNKYNFLRLVRVDILIGT